MGKLAQFIDVSIAEFGCGSGKLSRTDKFKANFQPLFELTRSKKEFPLLSGVDEYGHTLFNNIQVREIIKELGLLEQKSLSKEQQAALHNISELAKKARLHAFLLFDGD